MHHGYTNDTSSDGEVVTKRYLGPDAAIRLERERRMLVELRGSLPVPPLKAVLDDAIAVGLVPGLNGQELIDAGHAEAVLRSCGQILRRLHALPPRPGSPTGTVIVHGDFGPNNVLLDPGTFAVTAVLDWEFARVGAPVVDLAWCEWIVRMHHPAHAEAIGAFHAAYGLPAPPWTERRRAMVERCAELLEFCRRWEPDGEAVRLWQQRGAVTAAWSE